MVGRVMIIIIITSTTSMLQFNTRRGYKHASRRVVGRACKGRTTPMQWLVAEHVHNGAAVLCPLVPFATRQEKGLGGLLSFLLRAITTTAIMIPEVIHTQYYF